MFYRTIIFVSLCGFVLANNNKKNNKENDHPTVNIKFKIQLKNHSATCDHKLNDDTNKLKKYTVLEGVPFKIITKYANIVNEIICIDTSGTEFEHFKFDVKGGEATFQAKKEMGTIWRCTILTNRNNHAIQPVVEFNGNNYTAAYCHMKVHVRQKKPPQTILVNKIALPVVRTDLSDKDIDFTAEYHYADGDLVSVICANLNSSTAEPLTMEYAMADTLTDKFNSKNLSSSQWIGFSTTLRSGHNNTFMICTNTESTDYTKVKVVFVMRSKLNYVSIKINGMTIRPTLENVDYNYYFVDYKYLSNKVINVVCELNQTDMTLAVGDDYVRSISNYKRKDITRDKTEISFYLQPEDDKKLWCSCDSNVNNSNIESTGIQFTAADNLFNPVLDLGIPASGIVMEFYNDINLKVIIYEFEDQDGGILEVNCSIINFRNGPVVYVQLKGSEDRKSDRTPVSKIIHVSDNFETACYLKEQVYEAEPREKDRVLNEIRVIFREKSRISTTTTTTTTPRSPSPGSDGNSSLPIQSPDSAEYDPMKHIPMIAGVVVCIMIVCVLIVIIVIRKRKRSQGGPRDPNYRNFQTPSETSIPPHPPQCESNYAVPMDRRTEDTTYSVPFQKQALYSVPTPKNQRNKEQKDPTYAVVNHPNVQERKNVFKETNDPNYSEVYANTNEQCYAQVLPKSARKIEQDYNPYSNVTNESPYVNTDPEQLYCEPEAARGGTYANINNTPYANTIAREYVEPTYCELQKQK